MKILFLTDNFPPEVNAPATRTFEHCRQWVKQGAEVTIITCFPNFPQGKVYQGYKNNLKQVEFIEGIKVIRVWTYMTPNEGFVKRSLDYISFAMMAGFLGLFVKTDVIIATSPQFFTTWAGWFLSKVKRKPWIFELRDLWPESIATVGAMNKDSFIYKMLEKIELGLYRSANKIIPNTPAFKLNLIQRGIDASKIEVILNGANLDLYKPQVKDQNLVRSLKLENKFVYGYIGTHGMAHSLDFIMESLPKFKNENIHFLFIGDGAAKKQIVARSTQLNLKNVTFLNSITKDEVPAYLSIIDAALVPLKNSDTFRTVIPSKIFESAAMKKPILLGVNGQAKEIIDEFDAGLYFEPENEEDFINKAELLAKDYSLYDNLAKNCVHLAKFYDREKLATQMLKVIAKTKN